MTYMTNVAYKVLGPNGEAYHGGRGSWPLPHDGQPGEWIHVDGQLVPCHRGLHLCRRTDLIQWLGPEIYEAEFSGEPVIRDDKIVVGSARLLRRLDTWNETTARLFAADCAAYAVSACRRRDIPIDPRVSEAIRVARSYARGEIADEERQSAELQAAACAAESAADSVGSWAATWSALGSAARTAAWSAAKSAAWSAADSIAGSIAGSIASLAASLAADSVADVATLAADSDSDSKSAAWSAARAATRTWQTERLFEYYLAREEER
jgi:hypothetical protein